MTVHIPSPLRSYTANQSSVPGHGATLRELLADLDARHPGMRFRMIDEQGKVREHIRFFVGGERTDDLDAPVAGSHEVHIICAISGGAGESA